MTPSPFPHRTLAHLALLMALLIVYGSLVPFELRSVPLDQGIQLFAHIRWLDIALEERADWVANLILYVPLGFLFCGALGRRSQTLAVLVTAVVGAALAVEIEFAQIWIEPRTVSLNDIVAEIAGTLIGISLWLGLGKWLTRATQTVFAPGPEALRGAIILYLLVYCFVTLFPFDFLVSANELSARLAAPDTLTLIPRRVFSLRGILSLIVKGLLLAPLGAALWLVWRRGLWATALAAFALSSLLEGLHLFEYSEQTDAISIAAAVAGATAGNLLARLPVLHDEEALIAWLRRGAFLATPFYLLLLPVVRGWRHAHVSVAVIRETIAGTHWLPFYYHYFTSEGHALASVVNIAASFVPLGVLAFALRLRPGEPAGFARSAVPVALAALILAALLEVGGLVTAGNRPDPTNVLIAVAAAVVSQRACEWLARIVGATATAAP